MLHQETHDAAEANVGGLRLAIGCGRFRGNFPRRWKCAGFRGRVARSHTGFASLLDAGIMLETAGNDNRKGFTPQGFIRRASLRKAALLNSAA
jgi:hypothetical protein